MRKLGKGQSVVFCGPVEVQLKIRESAGKNSTALIEVSDVLKWCVQNTWAHTTKSIPLWATQGLRHYRRNSECSTSRAIPKSILEQEAETLEERYGFHGPKSEEALLLQNMSDSRLALHNAEIAAIRAKCQEFRITSFKGSALHEEQERELQPEHQREQQVEWPPPIEPYMHSVSKALRTFVTKGELDRSSLAFQSPFRIMLCTNAGGKCELSAWSQDLLVTTDFAYTVLGMPEKQDLDSFLRPVNWILTRKYGNRLSCVIISPFEANELIPLIRQHKKVTLHIYSPRLSMSLRTLEDLSFCALPPIPRSGTIPRIVTQVNLFAGQLYLRDQQEYLSLCSYLGLCSQPPNDKLLVGCDGFVAPANRRIGSLVDKTCRFTVSPVTFLKSLISLRQKGQGFANSHMGRILNGELLFEFDFQY